MGWQVTILAAWSLSGTAIYSYHECALSQVGTGPDMTLDVARMKTTNKQHLFAGVSVYFYKGICWIINKGSELKILIDW